MALEIHFQGGTQAGKVVKFADDVQQITIGRDGAHCQVVFPADETKVGREHCSLRRELGRYRLVLNKQDQVLVNGKHVLDGHELGPTADLQLGVGGPVLVVKTSLAEGFAPTIDQGHQRGLTSIERDTERSSRRGLWLAFAGVIAACLVGWFAYSKLWPEITKTAELTKQQQDALSNLVQRVATQQADQQRLQKALGAAAPSIYLVMGRNPAGHLGTTATAWVIDQAGGILATNGHVAAELPSATKAGYQLIVRSTDNPPRDFVIKSVTIHPGYEASLALWSNESPVLRTGEFFVEPLTSTAFCDVALMYVDQPAGLGPALPLADDATLHSIAAGNPAGSIGYPMENILLGGVNIDHPTPTIQMGHVTAITDYFDVGSGDPAQRFLVQNSIPAAGGASGSPVFNADGKVIAIDSDVNFITPFIGPRVPSGALINYAQRIDLLREFLEGRADAAQAQRSADWKQAIDQYFLPTKQAAQQITADRPHQIDNLFTQFVAENKLAFRLAAKGQFEFKAVTPLTNVAGTLSTPETVKARDGADKANGAIDSAPITVTVPAAGYLLVGAIAPTAPSIFLSDGSPNSTSAPKNPAIVTGGSSAPWFPSLVEIAKAGQQYKITVRSTLPPQEDDQKQFTLRAFLIATGPYWTDDMLPAPRADGMARQWVAGNSGWVAEDWRPKLVAQADGVIAEMTTGQVSLACATLPLKLSGGDTAGQDYLLVASAAQGQKIGLSVSPHGATTSLATDLSQANPWAKCQVFVADGALVDATVIGPTATPVTIRAYTAGPAASNDAAPPPTAPQTSPPAK